MRSPLLRLAVAGVVLFVRLAFSVTHRVPQEHATIQSAINAAAAGDTVLVSAGVYRENINFRGKAMVVLGVAAEQVTIDGGQPANADSGSTVTFVSQEGSSAVLEAVTITGGSGTLTDVGRRGGGIYCANAKPTIRNCIITGNTADYGGAIGIWHDNYQKMDGTEILGCLMHGNSAPGIWPGYATARIQNCTLYREGMLVPSFGWGTTVTNTVIWGATIGGAMAPASVNYCDIEGGWADGVGNINQDPLFCDPAAGDFHIAASSPCLHAGESGEAIGALGVGCDLTLTLDINIHHWNPPAGGGSVAVAVVNSTGSAEIQFLIERDVSWLSPMGIISTTPDTVTIRAAENPSFAERTGSVTFRALSPPGVLNSPVGLTVVQPPFGTIQHESFPLRRNLTVTYVFSETSESGGLIEGGIVDIVSDTGQVVYVLRDSVALGDSAIAWTGLEITDLQRRHWSRDDGDSTWTVRDTVSFSLRESLIDAHALQCSTRVWIFPLEGPSPIPVARYGFSPDTVLSWGRDPDSLSELGGGERVRLIADRGLASRRYGFYYSSMSIYRRRLSAVLLGDPVVSVSEKGGGRPDGFLLENYPNPFNPETIIRWQIALTSFVDLRVYDVLGREVAMLVNETRPAGRYEVVFDASRLATGIYLCRLSAGDFVVVRKMILLQ